MKQYIITKNKRNKRNIFLIILFLICFILVNFTIIYYQNHIYKINKSINDSIDGRTVMISPNMNDINTEEDAINYKYDYDKINSINYVIASFPSLISGGGYDSSLKDDYYDGRIGLEYGSDKILTMDVIGRKMNEEELMRMKKIEKREKVDIALAYMLIVILLGAIVVILYLKFIRKEEPRQDDQLPTYISLNEITAGLNSSTLANRYTNDGATFTSTVSNDAIVVTYTKGEQNININIPLVNNELQVNIAKENEKIITDTYKEIANIICKYYGNSEDSCRTTINNIKSDSQGIRFISDANNSYVYIDINKSVDVTNVFNSAYTEETKVTLDNTNYSLKISDTEISNITVTNSDTDIKVSGSIKNLSTEGTLSIIVKLYDNDGNVVGEDKKAYTADKALNGEDTFEFSFAYNDTLKKDNVKDYSINVVR